MCCHKHEHTDQRDRTQNSKTSPGIDGHFFLTKEPKRAFLTNGAHLTGYPHAKIILDPYSNHTQNFSSKWTIHLNKIAKL